MSENRIFKEFGESIYDRNENYKCICSKIKGGNDMKKKLLNTVAVLLMVLVVGATAHGVYAQIAWNIEYKEYENRNVITKRIALNEEIKNGWAENIDMDYIYKDEIGIKLKSFMVTNDYCEIGLDFKFDDKDKINKYKDNFYYSYAIYDEDNNIYAISGGAKYKKKLYKELGKKNIKEPDLSCSVAIGESGIEMESIEGFPQSKKIYIRIFNIGYVINEVDDEHPETLNFQDHFLSSSEWQFEIDVPERFYERTAIELETRENVEGITINKAELTETSLSIKVNINNIREFLMSGKDMDAENFEKLRDAAFYISDNDGNIYAPTDMGLGEKDEIRAKFGIGKRDLDKKIFLNVSLNEIQAKAELIQK